MLLDFITHLVGRHCHFEILDPLLLADGNLHCGMYPPGKVAISRHLVTPGFPRCDHTVGKLSADAGVH